MMRFSILFSLLISLPALSQFNPQYNSYMFNGLAINPAYTGSRECLSVVALHSSQWVGFKGAPITDYISIHSPLNDRHAFGLNVYNDRIGIQNKFGIYPSYAYHLKIAEQRKLAFGVTAGFDVLSVRNSDVLTIQQDNVFAVNNQTVALPNIGSGLYYYAPNFFAGFSIPNILTSRLTNITSEKRVRFDQSNLNYFVTLGGILEIDKNVMWKPSVLFKAISAGIFQLDVNSNVYFREKWNVGLSYRIKDALVGMLGFQFTDQFALGYSYSYPLSSIVNVSSGSHEVMLRYELVKKVKSVNSKYF